MVRDLSAGFIYNDKYVPKNAAKYQVTKWDSLNVNKPNSLLRNKYQYINNRIVPIMEASAAYNPLSMADDVSKIGRINNLLEANSGTETLTGDQIFALKKSQDMNTFINKKTQAQTAKLLTDGQAANAKQLTYNDCPFIRWSIC